MLSTLWSDIRYTLRTLRRHPGFAVAALVPIALGIGINTGALSIVNSVVLRPLPTPASTELIAVYQDFAGVKGRRVHGARSMFSIPEYRAFRDGTRALTGVMAYSRPWKATLGRASVEDIEGVLVTCNYFDVLQVRPVNGAGFTEANCGRPGQPPVVVLSHTLWTRAFAADPDIGQKTITLNGQSVSVVGVAPPHFDGIDFTKVAFFAPSSMQPLLLPERNFHEDPQSSWLAIVGRRARGVDLPQVRADLGRVAAEIDRQQPGRTTTLIVTPATSLSLPVARRGFMTMAAIVLAAFGLVLLIACANVANVLLARAASRTNEIAVRLSMGATRGRLIRQLFTESLTIAVIGGAAGTLLAWWSFQALLSWLLGSYLPSTAAQPALDARPDATVLAIALGLTVFTAVVFGMAPSLQASKQDVVTAMKQDGAQGGRKGGWLRGTLISLQVAVCLVLLISAGLLLRTLYVAQTIDPGFDYERVAMVSADLRGPAYDDARVAEFKRRVVERAQMLPGVEAVAHVAKTPLSPGRFEMSFRRLPDAEQEHGVDFNVVSPEYFSLLRMPIVRGRTFTAAESQGRPRAAIVTESTARRYWPGEDAVGRRILLGSDRETPLEIVGIVKDAHVSHAAETASSYIYLPAGANTSRQLSLLVRGRTDVAVLASSIHATVQQIDPTTLVRVNRLESNLERWRMGSRAIAMLSSALSLLALALAAVGVYGVVAYVVNRRRREVAIRVALGARSLDVQRLILRQTMRPVVVGVVIGIAGAIAATRVLDGFLFGISRFDPIAFVAAPLFLLGIAAAAALVPTRDVVNLDPMSTLRSE